jgi:lipopolysaccharide biosynthesis glycosyltransferase
MKGKRSVNIVYSSDENYVQHMGVSIFSLLEHNRDESEIDVYILANEISQSSERKLREMIQGQFGRKLEMIDFAPFREKLSLNMEWPISFSAYARLFLPEMLPTSCERVLYLDCDTVICGPLSNLWNINLNGCSAGGVLDTVLPQFKCTVGLKENEGYINSGVLLIDLKDWRENGIQKQFTAFIASHNGQVSHHDQGTINGVLHGKIAFLPPKFNAMTPVFTTRYENLFQLYHIEGPYYSKTEIREAKQSPVILHYVPEYVGRVWEYECRHPEKKRYQDCLAQTVWKGGMTHAEQSLSNKMRLIYWMQRRWPVSLQKLFFRR